MNTENNFQKVGKYKVDVADETNQAIRYVKSNPCCICSCENFCPIKYKDNREEILALNNPQEVGTIKSFTLELSYALIVELFDTINFTFPKGTYWATDDYKWLGEDFNETIYKKITIVKFSRKGREVTLGKANIGDGKVLDIDLSQTQEKLANKISKALRELKDLILCVNNLYLKRWTTSKTYE